MTSEELLLQKIEAFRRSVHTRFDDIDAKLDAVFSQVSQLTGSGKLGSQPVPSSRVREKARSE
jgi:tetrahydromethanopterin S-methyltransferase subunit G